MEERQGSSGGRHVIAFFRWQPVAPPCKVVVAVAVELLLLFSGTEDAEMRNAEDLTGRYGGYRSPVLLDAAIEVDDPNQVKRTAGQDASSISDTVAHSILFSR
ncbi:hypothetical protein GUJ93_ZPchr0006g45811 [Zizania palustris]|uniref:Uncharacterized protein n=1 Tax=Zizania palustris TaxID=103762 RepID=A0A8J5SXM4_ZIZPA|nr:hypothetical protein GUJ93_ZPchr0006g45811 [Zizania palustris]